jgi:hypothetical protein
MESFGLWSAGGEWMPPISTWDFGMGAGISGLRISVVAGAFGPTTNLLFPIRELQEFRFLWRVPL